MLKTQSWEEDFLKAKNIENLFTFIPAKLRKCIIIQILDKILKFLSHFKLLYVFTCMCAMTPEWRSELRLSDLAAGTSH